MHERLSGCCPACAELRIEETVALHLRDPAGTPRRPTAEERDGGEETTGRNRFDGGTIHARQEKLLPPLGPVSKIFHQKSGTKRGEQDGDQHAPHLLKSRHSTISNICVRCGGEFVPWRDSDEVCWECQGPGRRPTAQASPVDTVPEAQGNPRTPESRLSVISPGRLEMAVVWLHDLVSNGPLPVADVATLAQTASIAPRTLKRAKRALGVQSERQGGLGAAGYWTWRLPNRPVRGRYSE